MKGFIFVAMCSFAHFSFAHNESSESSATFTGEGLIKADADYVSLSFNVRSECQPSPKDAQESTDAAVKNIDNYLKKLKRAGDEHYKVLVNGGYTTSYSRWHDTREICKNTYQKSTEITLKLSMSDDFDKIFSTIQNYVLKQFAQVSLDEETQIARTYVSISSPNPQITHQHRKNIQKKAYDMALRDAKANFKAATSSCDIRQWKIKSITENASFNAPMPMYRSAFAKSASVRDEAAPVSFDLLEISKSLNVVFEFEGAMCFDK